MCTCMCVCKFWAKGKSYRIIIVMVVVGGRRQSRGGGYVGGIVSCFVGRHGVQHRARCMDAHFFGLHTSMYIVYIFLTHPRMVRKLMHGQSIVVFFLYLLWYGFFSLQCLPTHIRSDRVSMCRVDHQFFFFFFYFSVEKSKNE